MLYVSQYYSITISILLHLYEWGCPKNYRAFRQPPSALLRSGGFPWISPLISHDYNYITNTVINTFQKYNFYTMTIWYMGQAIQRTIWPFGNPDQRRGVVRASPGFPHSYRSVTIYFICSCCIVPIHSPTRL